VDVVKRGEIWLVSLDPAIGSEIRKTRPAVIISPDDMNQRLRTVIVAPLTSKGHPARFRTAVQFDGTPGLILLDQIRGVAKERLRRHMGQVEDEVLENTLTTMAEVFKP
jgi:mRNA interferase MazF